LFLAHAHTQKKSPHKTTIHRTANQKNTPKKQTTKHTPKTNTQQQKTNKQGHEPAVLAELTHDVPLPRQVVIEMHLRPVNESQPTILAKSTC
jgi:hypothetical protein